MFNTLETIDSSIYDGFSLFGPEHIFWIVLMVVTSVVLAVIYRTGCDCGCGKACPRTAAAAAGLISSHRRQPGQKLCRHGMRMVLAMLLLVDKILDYIIVAANHVSLLNYLPLHLCSISIIIAIIHAFTHKGTVASRYLGNFLYLVGLPGCLAAILFPAWTALPAFNLMSIHSFTVHILLIAYVVMCMAGGDIRPETKTIPSIVIALFAMAGGIYAFDIISGRNFMYLVHISKGSPLGVFEAMGDYRLGYAVMLAALIIVLYCPHAIRMCYHNQRGKDVNMNEDLLCPVCGRHYFSKNNSFEICPVCGWEDDRVQKENPDYAGGANKMSLNEARQKYSEEAEL